MGFINNLLGIPYYKVHIMDNSRIIKITEIVKAKNKNLIKWKEYCWVVTKEMAVFKKGSEDWVFVDLKSCIPLREYNLPLPSELQKLIENAEKDSKSKNKLYRLFPFLQKAKESIPKSISEIKFITYNWDWIIDANALFVILQSDFMQKIVKTPRKFEDVLLEYIPIIAVVVVILAIIWLVGNKI